MKLTLICGCGHTGSTILSRIIGEHSKIFFPKKEMNLFLLYNHFVLKKKIKEMKKILKKKKKNHLLEKTNRHLWHVDFIRRNFPKTKIILTTRNGKDVIGSLYKRNQNLGEAIKRYQDDSIYTIRLMSLKNIILIKYEDLIQEPEKTIKKIFKFMNLRFEPNVFSYYKKKIIWNMAAPKKTDGKGAKKHNFLRSYQINQKLFDGRNTWKNHIPKKKWGDLKKFFTKKGNKITRKNLGYQISKNLGY